MNLLAGLLLAMSAAAADAPWPRHVIDDSSRGADGVRLADVNGDGLLDIATGWEQGGVIRVYQNPGPSGIRMPWPAVTVGRVASPEDAVPVDLDNDGALDVVSSCEGKTQTVYFHWSPHDSARRLDEASWATEPVDATQRQQMWMYAAPADLDGRHGVDLVVGSKGPRASIGWLEAPENPRRVGAWKLHALRQAGWVMSLVMHDMDQDGDPDILFSDRRGPTRGVGWLENPGPEATRVHTPWREHAIGGTEHEVMFLAVGNWNRDERADVAVATSRGPVLLFERNPAADRWTRTEIALPPGCGTGKSAAIGDLNLDGWPDLVFSCENAKGPLSGVRWLDVAREAKQHTGNAHEISGPAGTKYDRVELLDLDADGDLDVLTCEEADNLGVIWYENPVRR